MFALASAVATGCGDDALPDAPVVPQLVISQEAITVAEGGSTTFTVSLTAPLALTGALTVTPVDTAVTVNPQVVTFTAGDTAAKTITVTGAQDSDLANESTSITLSVAGVEARTIAATVTDDDSQALVINPTSATMVEGGTAQVSVHLMFAPDAATNVSVTTSDAVRLAATPATLSFTAADYATPRMVTLTAAQDADVESNAVTVMFDGGGAGGSSAITITDNDVQNISANVASIALTEADEPQVQTFQVVLTQAPSSDVSVMVTSSEPGAATVTPSVLTFTPADYADGAAHVVTVTPVSDNDVADESLAIQLSAAGLAMITLPTTVDDDDVQAIQLNPATIAVDEDDDGAIGVSLAFDPGAQVTVNVASSDPGAATVGPATLTFDSTNYANQQMITVAGVEDDDLEDESLTMMATTAIAPTVTAAVTVNDDDTQSIDLTYAGAPGTLNMSESTPAATSTATVGVRLGFRPAADTTVTIVSNNPDLTVSPNQVTFSPLTFAVPQNITLTAVDENDLLPDTATVTFSAGALSSTMNVDIADTDVQGFTVTPANLPSLAEGGQTTFTVRMNLPPTAAVNATVSSNNPKILINGGASTTITVPLDNTPQSITVTSVQDPDAADESATITVADQLAAIAPRLLNISANDDETMAFVLIPVTQNVDGQRLDVLEGGANVTFQVGLTAAPTSNTTVSITPSTTNTVQLHGPGDTFGATATVSFTPADFANRTVTVRGLADPNLVDEIFNLTVAGPSDLGAADSFVYMRKIEDDAQSILTTPTAPGPITVTEGSSSSTLGVRLEYQPATTVQVTVTPSAASVLLGGVSAPQVLLFTTSNYDQIQDVTVTTPSDLNQEAPAPASITVSSPALASRVINVQFEDDDEQSIILSAPSTTIQEAPAPPNNGMFTVRLAFEPTGATEVITVSVPPAAQSILGVCTSVFNPGFPCMNGSVQLTFSNISGVAGGWDQPQTVFMQSGGDADVNNEEIPLGVSSNLGTPSVTHTVNIVDDDLLNLVVGPGQSSTIHETVSAPGDVTSAIHTVRLNFDPTSTVTVTLTSADPAAVTVSPASLTFDSSDYFSNKNFTVSSVVDADVRNELVNVTLSTAGATPSAQVAVTVIDHDQQGIVLVDGGLEVNEGGNDTSGVRLAQQPTANVTLSVGTVINNAAGQAPGQSASVANATMTFTPSNWDQPQLVTLSSPQDTDVDHFTGTVPLAVTSGQTGQELAASTAMSFGVRDDDSQAITVTNDPVGLVDSVQEGGPASRFRVRLTRRPRNAINDTVTLTAPGNALFESTFGNTTTLTFTDENFDTDQVVRWFVPEGGDNVNFTGNMGLGVDESGDPAPPFAPGNQNASATHAIRVIDDEQTIINGIDLTSLNGATQFTQRSNVAFGFDGSAEGAMVISGRTLPEGGDGNLGFGSRSLSGITVGPQIAIAGADPTTEIIEFDADDDGAGSDVAAWNVFASDATGIVYARFDVTGAVIVPKTVVAPASSNATDFSVTRNGAIYGMVYRREATSRNNLYFRSVSIATGVASGETVVTTADTFTHFHPTILYVGDGNVTTYDPGTGDQDAPYVTIYSSNGQSKLVRMTPTGAPLGNYTFSTNFPGDFSHSVYVPSFFWGSDTIVSLAVHSIGPGLGDNRVFLHVTNLTSSGTAAEENFHFQASQSPMVAVGPPFIAFNGSDFVGAFDDSLGGTNRVGTVVFGSASPREFRLDGPGDEGVFPSLAWAGDRWLLRYQADSPTSNGVRVRSGSFDSEGNIILD